MPSLYSEKRTRNISETFPHDTIFNLLKHFSIFLFDLFFNFYFKIYFKVNIFESIIVYYFYSIYSVKLSSFS